MKKDKYIYKREGKDKKTAVKLGDTIEEFMESKALPQWTKYNSIVELWNQMLPDELSRHCRIVDISGGRLKVLADSPSYMYELNLLSKNIIFELQRRCPRHQIQQIKIAIG